MFDNGGRNWESVRRSLGKISKAQYQIDSEPVKEKSLHWAPYRAGPNPRQFGKSELDKMLEVKVIEMAETEWAGPVVFALRKDGSLRFHVDYR